MIRYDWNRNAKTSNKSNRITAIGAVLSIITGLVVQSALYTVLEIDVKNVPVFIIIVLWIVLSSVTAYVADTIGL